MGTAAMGLAGGIGGAGNAAAEYGRQIRGILEQRREGLANFLSQQMALETDPQRRAELAGHVSDLYSGKDMSKIAPALFKTAQSHAASDAALGQFGQQLTGAGGAPPPPPPGPAAPGQTPGATPAGAPPAAQAPTSPISPVGVAAVSQPPTIGTGGAIPAVEAKPVAPPSPAPTGNIPSVMGAPSPTSPLMNAQHEMESLLQRYHSMYAQSTPAMRPQILAEMNAEVARLTPFLQKQMQMDNLTGYQDALYKLQGDKQFQALPFMAQMQHLSNLSQAYGFQPSSLPYGYMGAANRIETKPEDAAALEQKYPGILAKYRIDPSKTPVVNVSRNPMMQMQGMDMPVNVEGVYPGTTTVQTPGGMANAPKLPGVIPGAVPPVLNRPVGVDLATGQRGLVIPSGGSEATPIPGSTVPSLATTQRSTQAFPSGLTTTTASKIPPGGVPSVTAKSGGGVPTHDQSGRLLGNDAWKNRVNTIVSTLMIPNQSEGQINTARKTLVGPDRSPLAEAVRVEMANRVAADPGPIAWDLQTSERAQLSTQTLQHIADINKLVDKLGKEGQLGPVMGRWNEFWTGTIGSDLTKNQDYVNLKNQIGLLTKIMGRIHGGARGGGSIQMIENFKKDLTQEKMDPQTLKSALSAEQQWLETYANPKHTAVPQAGGAVPPVAGAPQPFDANAARSKYNY